MPQRPFRRRLLTCARWTAIVYLLLVLIMWYARVGDRLIAQPAPGPLPAPGAERFVIPYSHGELEAFRAVWPTDQTPQICVLYFVGNEDRVNPWVASVARTWSEQTGLAVECVGVNLPGFGLSTGPANLDRMAPTGLLRTI